MRYSYAAIFGFGVAGFAASAAASPTNVQAGYYRNYTCQQLLAEAQKVNARAIALSGAVNEVHAKNDTASTEDVVAVPNVIFENKPVAGELALIKQRLLAIEDASIQDQCAIEFSDPTH